MAHMVLLNLGRTLVEPSRSLEFNQRHGLGPVLICGLRFILMPIGSNGLGPILRPLWSIVRPEIHVKALGVEFN